MCVQDRATSMSFAYYLYHESFDLLFTYLICLCYWFSMILSSLTCEVNVHESMYMEVYEVCISQSQRAPVAGDDVITRLF